MARKDGGLYVLSVILLLLRTAAGGANKTDRTLVENRMTLKRVVNIV